MTKVDTSALEKRFDLTPTEARKFRDKWRGHFFYTKGRNDAANNPIEFKLSLEDWVDIWLSSGKWPLRGTGVNQYVMSRINDVGHYEVGNVFIQTHAQNSSPSPLAPPRRYPNRKKRSGQACSEATKEKLRNSSTCHPVTVNGNWYRSKTAAADELGVSDKVLVRMMRTTSFQ